MELDKAIKNWWKNKDVKKLTKAFFNTELTPKQEIIVRAVAFDIHPRTVICCMTRYGKSYCVALGILLWIIRNQDKKIAIVAPTREKTSIIRNYIANFVSRSSIIIRLLDLEKTGGERIRKEVSKTRMTWKNGVEMRTLTAEGTGGALMGFGADKIIVDETCDINYEVYRSKITRMLGDNPESTYIEIGNPWHRDNQMWQHWTNPDWLHIHIGYKEALDEGRVSHEFIDEQRKTITEREFKILYDADFPEESEDQLIKWGWIQEALKKQSCNELSLEIVAGADIAEKGNDTTVLTTGTKNKENGEYEVKKIFHWDQAETMTTKGKIAETINELGVKRITVDSSGIGAGVYSRLQEIKRENKISCSVMDYRGGRQPITKAAQMRFLNQKAQAYFNLRDLFEKKKIKLINNTKLIDQLTKMKWELTSNMKIKILDPGMAVDDTAEQKSPDYADSLCYFCWEGGTPPLVIMDGDFIWKKPIASAVDGAATELKTGSSLSVAGI